MTEPEWRTSDNPLSLLAQLRRPQRRRKVLLYAVACCRANWHLLRFPASRDAVEWAERRADGVASHDDEYSRLEWASEGAAFHCESVARPVRVQAWAEGWEDADCRQLRRLAGRITEPDPNLELFRQADAAYFANQLMSLETSDPTDPRLGHYPHLLSASLLRDVFGNPFRPAAFDTSWRSDTAVSLARTMYESRDFAAMPILADALQDAGCENDEVLTHCRDPKGVHVRGCWVVDWVLDKA